MEKCGGFVLMGDPPSDEEVAEAFGCSVDDLYMSSEERALMDALRKRLKEVSHDG